MSRMKCAAMILVLSTAYSTGADDDANKKMLKDLGGLYKVVAFELGGDAMSKDFLDKYEKITIKDGMLSIYFKGEEKPTVQTIKVDAAKKPAHIDLTQIGGPGKGYVGLGIIAVEGDTIKICDNAGLGERPTEFKTTNIDGNVLMTLRKIKK